MPLLPPLNDKPCLGKSQDKALAYMETPNARAIAAQLGSVDDLIELIRSQPQRDDLGDPDDGPRLPCVPSQRLRLPALDPMCLERTMFFIPIALLIDPELTLTSATMMLDNGLHTFPVEIRDGSAHPIVLDPMTTPPRNTMVATVYELRNTSPQKQLVPWFTEVARNACAEEGAEECYEIAMEALRRALLTGEPIEQPDELACVLALVEQDAGLFGARGRAAYQQVHRSVRNLSIALDTGRVAKVLTKLAGAAEPLASEAIKTALIAKFGPAALIALQGVDLAMAESTAADDEDEDEDDEDEIESKREENDNDDRNDTRARLRRVRRMTFAFRH